MIAPDRQLVRRLRQQVKARVDASPALRRARRQARGSRWRRQYGWAQLRSGVPVLAFFLMWSELPAELLFALATVWTLGITFLHAALTANALHDPAYLWIPFTLPVDNDRVFRHQRTLILRSASWLAFDWLALGCGHALRTGELTAWFAAPVIGVAQGAVALALTLWAVRFAPRGQAYTLAAMVTWVALFICARFYGHGVIHENFIAPLLGFLRQALPVGWLLSAFSDAVAGGVVGWAALVGGVAAAVFAIERAWEALRKEFSPERVFEYEATPAADTGATLWTSAPADATPSSAAAVAPQLQELAPPAPPPIADLAAVRAELVERLDAPAGLTLFARGWLEAGIVRVLTPRQRVLIDFLRPINRWSWGLQWLVALGMLMIAAVLQRVPGNGAVAGLVAAGALVAFALPLFGGTWAACSGITFAHQRVGMQSFVPAGFWEIARLMLTVNALRILAALPLLLLALRHGFTPVPLPWGEALFYSLGLAGIVLATNPIWVLLAFSKTTNDGSSCWWFGLLMVLGFVMGLVAFVLVIMVFFAAFAFEYPIVALGLFLLGTHALLAGYGLAYRRGVFDLITRPEPTNG